MVRVEFFLQIISAFVLLTLASESSRAQQNFVLRAGSFVDKVTPKTKVVDHSKYFLDSIDQQETGSCHVHAATALIEAFCTKVTGAKIDISESYFFYRHMRTQLETLGMYSISSDRLLDEHAGGSPRSTFERFKMGSICSKDEFEMTDKGVVTLFESVREYSRFAATQLKPQYDSANSKAVQSCASFSELEKSLEKIREEFNKAFRQLVCAPVDGEVACYLKPSVSKKDPANPGQMASTKNPNLIRCVEKFSHAETINNPTPDKLMELLNAGDPILCSGHFFFLPGSGFEKEKMIDNGTHGLVIYGYRKDPKNAKPEFLVRDSNFASINPYTVTGCDSVVVLRQKKPSAPKPTTRKP